MPRKNLFIAHKSYIKQHCTVIRNLWYVISTETIIYGVRNSSIYNFYILRYFEQEDKCEYTSNKCFNVYSQ